MKAAHLMRRTMYPAAMRTSLALLLAGFRFTEGPSGKHLRTLKFPEKPANVTFGGKDRSTLYVTARTSVYVLPVKAKGHMFAAR